MKVLSTPKGWNNNWSELPKYLVPLDDVPRGFQTTAQIAKELGIEPATALKRIKYWVDNGLVEVCKFKIRSGTATRSLRHYRRIKNVKTRKN